MVELTSEVGKLLRPLLLQLSLSFALRFEPCGSARGFLEHAERISDGADLVAPPPSAEAVRYGAKSGVIAALREELRDAGKRVTALKALLRRYQALR